MICPRLIEVALPIREISVESVRDKRIDQGNISSLHTWWARRPLAASRAVVFASLVPDPDDKDCPSDFRKAVDEYLRCKVPLELRSFRRGRENIDDPDPYKPYAGLADTLRNRLLMFIGKWSPEQQEFETGASEKPAATPQLLDNRCLVKWETSDPDNPRGRAVLNIARELVKAAHPEGPPTLLDPFAGGGVIPLEGQRLGARAIASDYNPVAYLVLRGTCEYPQQYGRPGKPHVALSGSRNLFPNEQVRNVLIADIQACAQEIVGKAESKLAHLYPPGSDALPVLVYLWARTVPCANPACRAEIPLIRSFVLRAERPKIALRMQVNNDKKLVAFDIVREKEIRTVDGTKSQRGPATCPFCHQATSEVDIRRVAVTAGLGQQMVAVVVERDGRREYRSSEHSDVQAFEAALELDASPPREFIVPEITAPNALGDAGGHASIRVQLYGMRQWGQLFNHRQLVALNALIDSLHQTIQGLEDTISNKDYRNCLAVYLSLWISRLSARMNSVCRWFPGREAIQSPFSGQSIAMMWDYPEVNPFSNSPAGALNQLARMLEVIERESTTDDLPRASILHGSATDISLRDSSCDLIVTDPPYGDAIAYADLSDFFYVWLKRCVGDTWPMVFQTPQTPKAQEATSHKHRHQGSKVAANKHYQGILQGAFRQCDRVLKPPKLLCVMFAHQTTEAWEALLTALFDAGFCPNATWPIATEMPNAALGLGTASLESSVTVVCRPRNATTAASYKDVRKEIQHAVEQSVKRFWDFGFRGADLIVACYGPAVGVFGRYRRVERADGTPVEIPELLELARKAARDAIAGEFQGDALSTLYYVWSNLYGTSQQSWDDARLVVQIGSDAESAMDVVHGSDLFVIDGANCRLALLQDRVGRRALGHDLDAPLIDQLHHAMHLWNEERRRELVVYLRDRALLDHAPFWKLAQALFEVLPRNEADWKLVSALLGERETLRVEARRATPADVGLLF